MERKIDCVIGDEFSGKPVKVYLRRVMHMSARTVNILKNDPLGLLLNGEHVRTVDPLTAGDVLSIRLPAEENGIAPMPFDDLRVVYEDADVMVVNKPAGLAVHPTHNHQGDTLANMVAGYLKSKDENCVFRAVGRLDKQTSGLVLIALNRHAASRLQDHYEKTYLAIAQGEIAEAGTVDLPIVRPDPNKTLRAVGDDGEPAVTHYTPLLYEDGHTLLRLTLETGRTHQIRVHMASVGHPLAGDEMYGGNTARISRAALHCAALSFRHPVTGEALSFIAPVPEDFFLRLPEKT